MEKARTRSTPESMESMNRSVLVVDSDARNLVLMSTILQRLGYHACSALGVGNALEIASASSLSLIVTELRLKGLSGLDLLQHIRQLDRTAAVPVIVMTHDLAPEIEQQCRRAGALSCISKPVQVNELYDALQPVLEPGSRRRNVRIPTRLSVLLNDRPLDCADGECATNLSANGMYLRTLRPYPEGSEVVLQVSLQEEAVRAEARVVHCQSPDDRASGTWGIGLQFVRTSPGAKEIIRRFINDEVAFGILPAIDE